MWRTCCLFLLLSACVAPSAEPIAARLAPIIDGEFQPGDPAVVALVDSLGLYCSGTLVSPHVVLTAAHCIAGERQPTEIYFGSDPASGGTRIAVADHHAHADYAPRQNDVAVVVLAEPAPADVDPVPMARRPPPVGVPVRFVGFGCRATGGGCGEIGQKYQVTTEITEVGDSDFRYGVATCDGDSGGPAFVDEYGREVLAGLTSWGDTPCEAFGVDTRIDSFRAWVLPFIREADPAFVLVDPPLPEEDAVGSFGCQVGGPGGSPPAVLLLGFLLLARRRRRQ